MFEELRDNLKKSPYTVKHDKWDRKDYANIEAEIREFGVAARNLGKIGGSLADPMMADEFYALVKSLVNLRDPKDIRPSFRINAEVMNRQFELQEFDSLKTLCVGDPIGAALAAAKMEPTLEIILDKLKHERKQAQEMESQLEAAQALMDERDQLDPEARDYQEQAALIDQQLEAIDEAIRNLDIDLADCLAEKATMIRNELLNGIHAAEEFTQNQEDFALAWGLEPGELKNMDPKKRLELAEHVNNEKFRKIAALIGPMIRSAISQRKNKTDQVPVETISITLGDDLTKLVPSEFAFLTDPLLMIEWMRRFADQSLVEYELIENESLERGGIIYCQDGSGSMSGNREAWGKAFSMALLNVAIKTGRDFTGVHFGGPAEMITYEFETRSPRKTCRVFSDRYKIDTTLEGMDGVIEFVKTHFNGGTNFVTPLDFALSKLQAQHKATGAVKGDIVFLTDGECGVPSDWLNRFCEERQRLGFRVFGIIIGGNPLTEPLNTICDGNVTPLNSLVDANAVKHIFTNL